MANIYHLVLPSLWETSPDSDFHAESLSSEGFIHCSFAEQVPWAANRFYADAVDLLLLEIDPKQLTSPVKVEPPPGSSRTDRLFPHIYGPIQRQAVVAVHPLQRGPDRQWLFTP